MSADKKAFNAADQEQVEKKQDEDELIRKQELKDLKEILQTASGQRFINRLFSHCMMYRSSFTGNSQTFFNEGMRNIALWLFDDIRELAEKRELSSEALIAFMLNQVKEN